MKMGELLERMWFAPISHQDPVYLAQDTRLNTWHAVEAVVPVSQLLTIQLKREGYAPVYVSEVDLGRDQAILSLVMEC